MHATAESAAPIEQAAFPWWRSAVILTGLIFLVSLILIQGRPKGATDAGVIMSLPYKLGTYWGTHEEPSDAEKRILPPDTEIERRLYEDFSGNRIQCSIVLSGIERRSIHRPEVCLPGQGWTIRSSRVVPIELASGKKLRVMELLLERDVVVGPGRTAKVQSVFYYWFVGKNFTTPEHLERVIYSSWDLIFHNLNHRWAYVSVTGLVTGSVSSTGNSLEKTQDMLRKFIRESVPYYQISEMVEAK